MPKTARTRCYRKNWLLAYQDPAGSPEDDIRYRPFSTDVEAMAWADDQPAVALWLEEREELIGESGRVIGVSWERHPV
jgi:hypothetical protein